MRTRFLRGTTAENNSLMLPKGELSVDLEKKAVRLHDGSTLGGWEMVGSPIEFSSPGPTELIAGNATAGFYGEVNNAELIDGETLAFELGISEGTPLYTTAPWLKFSHNGKILFVAKKSFREGISWTGIHSAGAVFGSASITVKQQTFKVRLLTGAASDPLNIENNFNSTSSHYTDGSEWNALLYPIASVGPRANEWASYTEEELGIKNEGQTWVQETAVGGDKILRGVNNIDDIYTRDDAINSYRGWRPVLELVQ